MRYRTISCLIVSAVFLQVQAQITETATDAVRNMGLGWNLGNALEANSCTTLDVTQDSYWGGQGLDSETCWGQSKTTNDLITMMKEAGIGAIRVPVTWYNHMDKEGKVDALWMDRVREVVDYIIGNGLYCILNVHHDTGADSNSFVSWIKADTDNYSGNKVRYEYLWQQIATEFQDYDNHLVFEAYNEMLDTKSSWCYASFNTSGKYDATIATSAYNGLNSYGQSFVNVVRNTGGNNASRNLIVSTYAAATGYGGWNTHLTDVLTKKTLPDDTASGHLIFEVHDYPSLTNNGSNRTIANLKAEIDGTISLLKNNLVSKGAPVIIGEWGTSNVDAGSGKTDYDLRRDLMLQFAEYFVQKCKENGIATFYWMGLSDGLYRSIPAFNQADLAECLAKAYHGSDFQGEYPTANVSAITAFEGEKTIYGYNGNISIDATSFQMVGYPMTVSVIFMLTSSVKYGYNIQLLGGDWTTKPSFTVGGKTYSSDFNPTSVYGSVVGTEHAISITFDEATYNTLSQKGLIIQGDGITITQVTLNAGTTGVTSVVTDESSAGRSVYTLAGQSVSRPVRGLYIKEGRAFVKK